MGCTSTTEGCETLLSLSEQATKPVSKSNATETLRTRLSFFVIYMPAPLTDFVANVADTSDLLNDLCVSGTTHKTYNTCDHF